MTAFMGQWGILLFFALVLTRATSLLSSGRRVNSLYHLLVG